jgi:hypothetical protein
MTEADWLVCEDPEIMYPVAREELRADYSHGVRTKRKRSFFGAACCRLVWSLVVLDKRCRRTVEYNEQKLDKPLSARKEEELYWNAKQAAEDPASEAKPFLLEAANLVYDSGYPDAVIRHLLHNFEGWGDRRDLARQVAGIMRDIVGNPFRPIVIKAEWLTPPVVSLAQQTYDSRSFSALPILADALEDAGCSEAAILDHCRGPGPHVLGCFAVDLILGKQ